MDNDPDLILVIDSVRSLYNVGALLRTADGLGIKSVVTLGETPYPRQPDDRRLPHVIERAEKQLQKTALGAELSINCRPAKKPSKLFADWKKAGYQIISLEQTAHSVAITKFRPSSNRLVLIVGNEISGVSEELLKVSDAVIEIPMLGKKNSLNVASAGAIAMFYLSAYCLKDLPALAN